MFGLAIIVFMQFSRIVIFSPEWILNSNRILYPLFFSAGICVPIFTYHISDKKDKILLVLALLLSIIVPVIIHSSIINTIFTGDVVKSEIGIFPSVNTKIRYM
ncbi:MAG TPA: hypothetical protein PKA14_05150, partial [Leptospiraceae bacterium]|nr:hypothetical protein [Leptospiraceae bacterium]